MEIVVREISTENFRHHEYLVASDVCFLDGSSNRKNRTTQCRSARR
jgi:hypothetical protein